MLSNVKHNVLGESKTAKYAPFIDISGHNMLLDLLVSFAFLDFSLENSKPINGWMCNHTFTPHTIIKSFL